MGSDDYLWKPDVLERMREHLVEAATNKTRLVYGQVAVVADQGNILKIVGKPWGCVKQPLWKKMKNVHTQGLMCHKSLFEEYGKFDEAFYIAGDIDLFLRELKTADAYFISGLVVGGYGYGGISSVPVNKARTLKEIAWAYRKNKVGMNWLVWLWSYTKAVMHAFLVRFIGVRSASYVADFYRIVTGHSTFWTRLK